MSNLQVDPTLSASGSCGASTPVEKLLEPRRVLLGKTTEVQRLLPNADIRMIGAWCFLDHYGPEDIRDQQGMLVPPHPHTGLQTVSWLISGEILHQDGLGSRAFVRPGELNVMTAGPGIAHSEESPGDHSPIMHGVQLWVALPDCARDSTPPAFDQYPDLPVLTRAGMSAIVMVGSFGDVRSPVPSFTPLAGAEVTLEAAADVLLPLDPSFEYGVLVVEGSATVAATAVHFTQLLYLGCGRDEVRLRAGSGARLIVLGGQPFDEQIVMWWNFVGRTHDEIVGYRASYEADDGRFAPVRRFDGARLPAPPMPSTTLRARPRQRGH